MTAIQILPSFVALTWARIGAASVTIRVAKALALGVGSLAVLKMFGLA